MEQKQNNQQKKKKSAVKETKETVFYPQKKNKKTKQNLTSNEKEPSLFLSINLKEHNNGSFIKNTTLYKS